MPDLVYLAITENTNGLSVYVFQNGGGVMTDRSLEQYVDLGNLTVACITRPETCDNGATVTLWVKVLEVRGYQGIITSLDRDQSTGFFMLYALGSVR